jgi:sigma-B regulation protein RsbU (phosphoserine phosphatase)
MQQPLKIMTAAPLPRQPNSNKIDKNSVKSESTPILALKELVARLYREQNKIQNLLSSLGFALRSFNNLNQFLELTPLMAARVTDADGGALILFNNQGQVRLEQLHCQNNQKGGEIRRQIAQITRKLTISNNKALEGTIVLSCPAALDEQIRQVLPTDIQLFGTPILVKNAERGRLYIFSTQQEYSWNPTRRKLLQLVADQTAVAIANHELTVELRAKERQDRELEIASEIQLRLLPRQCPKIKGAQLAASCKTANRVGGDYYDFIPVNYDQLRENQDASVPWSIVIGDVMGKGVPAGLIMTMTRGMLRAEVLNRHSPARIMEHLNRVMYEDLENSRRFVTLFYSEYDPQTQILSYTNAAHNPPLLWQASTNLIKRLDTKGMLIGLVCDSEYEDAQIQLAPGDTIMYYTDGLTDAINQYGERFDEDNLYQTFAWACQHFEESQDILDYLFQQIEEFSGSENKTVDDMTLVIMRVKSRQ